MKTLLLTALTFIVLSAHSQTCKLTNVAAKEIHFSMYSPEKKKAYIAITDTFGNIKWAKKVKIRKGRTEPKLYVSDLVSGAYIIRIGDFFREEVKL